MEPFFLRYAATRYLKDKIRRAKPQLQPIVFQAAIQEHLQHQVPCQGSWSGRARTLSDWHGWRGHSDTPGYREQKPSRLVPIRIAIV